MLHIPFLFVFLNLNAELVLEITESSDNPYRIAIHNFDGQTSISNEISAIIKADLQRTGEFSVLSSNDLLEEEAYQEELNYIKFLFDYKKGVELLKAWAEETRLQEEAWAKDTVYQNKIKREKQQKEDENPSHSRNLRNPAVIDLIIRKFAIEKICLRQNNILRAG